jgi:SpoVK/Ycf46/Vps4 family AAA+-type ATPase
MDGLHEAAAFVLLATNRPSAIDAAILRDGRVDHKIKVERPDEAAAREILRRAFAGVPLHDLGADRLTLNMREAEQAFADFAVAQVFDLDRKIVTLVHERGRDWLRLGDIVSGAMLVNLVERAKGNAFRRDLAAGGPPTGVRYGDLAIAADTIFAENLPLNHSLRDCRVGRAPRARAGAGRAAAEVAGGGRRSQWR